MPCLVRFQTDWILHRIFQSIHLITCEFWSCFKLSWIWTRTLAKNANLIASRLDSLHTSRRNKKGETCQHHSYRKWNLHDWDIPCLKWHKQKTRGSTKLCWNILKFRIDRSSARCSVQNLCPSSTCRTQVLATFCDHYVVRFWRIAVISVLMTHVAFIPVKCTILYQNWKNRVFAEASNALCHS